MIKNENDLLGFLIKNMNSDNECNSYNCLTTSGLDNHSFLSFIKSLESKNYITTLDFCTYRVTDIGLHNYESPTMNTKKSFFSFSKYAFNKIICFIAGIISALVAAYIVYKMGW